MTASQNPEGSAVSDLTGQRWRVLAVHVANELLADAPPRSEILVTPEAPGLRLIIDQPSNLVTSSDVARALNHWLRLLAA